MASAVPTMAELLALFDDVLSQHHQAFDEAKVEKGYIGYIDFTQAKWVVNVPTRPNYVYVTLKRTSAYTVVEALNMDVVPKGGLDVEVERINGEFVVKPDRHGANTFSQGGANLTVGKHTHRLGYGNEDTVEALRFEPLQCHVASGGTSLTVQIEAAVYRYNNEDVYFPRSTIDLTSNLPPTSGMWAWVKIGIDPTTNLPVAKTGTEYPKVYELSPVELVPIAFDSNDTIVLRTAGVKLRNGQSAVADFRDFYDLRPFASGMNAPSSAGAGDETLHYMHGGF